MEWKASEQQPCVVCTRQGTATLLGGRRLLVNLIETVWIPLLIGVLSSLIASAIAMAVAAGAARLRSGRSQGQPPPVVVGDNVQGDKIHGDKVTNQRYEHHEHHHHQSPRTTPNRAAAPNGDSDHWGVMIGAGVAVVVAVLAFLIVWQYVLGLMIGAALVLVLAAGWLTMRTQGCPPCRKRLRSLWFNTIVGVVAGAITWRFILQDRADGAGLPGALAKVSKTYPRFDDGIPGRWAVMVEHGPDIPSLLGAHSVFLIAFQILAIAAVLVIALFACFDAYALVTAHWESSPPAPSRGDGQALVTLVLAGLALALAGGPAESLLVKEYPVVPADPAQQRAGT